LVFLQLFQQGLLAGLLQVCSKNEELQPIWGPKTSKRSLLSWGTTFPTFLLSPSIVSKPKESLLGLHFSKKLNFYVFVFLFAYTLQ
jgi:hypothetical protein